MNCPSDTLHYQCIILHSSRAEKSNIYTQEYIWVILLNTLLLKSVCICGGKIVLCHEKEKFFKCCLGHFTVKVVIRDFLSGQCVRDLLFKKDIGLLHVSSWSQRATQQSQEGRLLLTVSTGHYFLKDSVFPPQGLPK